MNFTSLKRVVSENLGIFATLWILNIFFSVISPYYLTAYNFNSMIHHAAFTLVMATGMVLVIATGGIDVSVGSTMAFVGLIAAKMMLAGVPVLVTIAAGLILGGIIGSINGLVIAKLRLQPLIVTLAMLSILRGATLVVSKGYAVTGLPESFLSVFAGHGMIKNGLYIGVAISLIGFFIVNKTPFGVFIRSIGDSEECCFICGINVSRIKILTYAIQGVLAVFASLVFMASVDAAEPSAGLSTEWMEAIAAPIIGGNRLSGGKANIGGMIIGALILSTIRSGLNISRVNPAYQQVVMGLVIIIAVVIDSLRTKERLS